MFRECRYTYTVTTFQPTLPVLGLWVAFPAPDRIPILHLQPELLIQVAVILAAFLFSI